MYVGDGNNVAASLAFGPRSPAWSSWSRRRRATSSTTTSSTRARNLGGVIELVADPHEAVDGADAVYTDVWTSMGQEHEADVRARPRSPGYRWTPTLMAAAGPEAWFLHCLPAHRGEEVSADVIDGPRVGRVAAGREPDARRRGRCSRIVLGEADLMATLGKPQRQHRIARLLEEQVVSSQAQLVELLGAEGVRGDAGHGEPRPRGARRGEGAHPRRRDGLRDPRAREGTRRAPDDHLRRVMGEFVVEVSHSGEPRRAAHAARAPRTSSARRSTAPGSPTCSAPSPATTRSSSCAPKQVGGAAVAARARRARRARDSRSTDREQEGADERKRVVLAYSGGLDTSVAVRWMQEEWGAEVVALAVDVGQIPDGRPLGGDHASARSRPVRSRRSSSTPRAEFADGVHRAGRSRPTRCTRASTRWCRRCRVR